MHRKLISANRCTFSLSNSRVLLSVATVQRREALNNFSDKQQLFMFMERKRKGFDDKMSLNIAKALPPENTTTLWVHSGHKRTHMSDSIDSTLSS